MRVTLKQNRRLLSSGRTLQFISHRESHIIKNELELHDESQSAYRKFHSTETALLKVSDDILCPLDQGAELGYSSHTKRMLLTQFLTWFRS